MRLRRSGILVATLALVAVMVGTTPAAAATTTSWASWQALAGTGGAYTTTVQIAAQPALTATMTSDSRSGQVGVISGASTWLSAGTPIGAKYGSSRDQGYLNLRPKADNATSPSTTTYSFAAPTPTSGWAFALGDIDSDSVRIRAVAPDGHVLDASEIGLRDRFNYCAPAVVGKPSCTGAVDDVPTWDAATLTLTGNAAAADTSGSAAWFEPSTPISSLSFIFTRRAGFPVYQTWFASISRDITGVVADQATGPLPGVALSLTDGNGTVVATTTTAVDGSYSFPGFVATDGYTVRVEPPDGKIAVGATTAAVDLTTVDGVADFTVRDIVPVAVSGHVTDTTGAPIAGVTVTIDGNTTTTDANGRYLFDEVAVGTHTATITTPTGYTIAVQPPPFSVPEESEVPITDVDFQLAENPDLSGVVRSNGAGVPGVTVTAVGPGGVTLTRVTDASGAYTFPGLVSGSYEITMSTPAGYVATTPVVRDEQVDAVDVADVDFELARLGAIDGTVRDDDGAPVAGVVVEVTGPGAPQQLTSDADGSYGLGALPPGTYTLTVVPPTGTSVVGAATRTVVITAAGEAVPEQDFTLAADVIVTPTPTLTPTPTPTPSTGGGNGSLPTTGLGPETFAWAAGGAAVLVLGATLLILGRRRSRR